MKLPYPYHNLQLTETTDRHFHTLCPFHNEDNPSFTINRTEPFFLYYRCWSCGKNGSAKKFAKVYLNHKHPHIKESKVKEIKRPVIDWKERLGTAKCKSLAMTLADKLGVSAETILKFDFGHRLFPARFMIPMYNGKGICGIQEHWWENGEHKKKCQRYSQHGWFRMNDSYYAEGLRPIFICEGFSDTVTIIDCGFNAIGRFNALSLDIPISIKANKPNRFLDTNVYIVSDTDKVGIEGSKKLQKLIPNSKILIPHGYADVREMYLDRDKEFTKDWLKGKIYLP